MNKLQKLCQIIEAELKSNEDGHHIQQLICYCYYDGVQFALEYASEVGHFFTFAGESSAHHHFLVEPTDVKALHDENIVLQDVFKQSFDKHGGYARVYWANNPGEVSIVDDWNDYPSKGMNTGDPAGYFHHIREPNSVHQDLDLNTFLLKAEKGKPSCPHQEP